MADSLTFELRPKSDALSLETLIDSISDLRKLIELVDYAVTRDKRGRSWLVERIQSSAPTITTRPEMDGGASVDAIANGIQILTAQIEPKEPPMYWTDDALDGLRDMRRLFRRKKGGVERIVVRADGQDVGAIRDNIRQQVDRVTHGGYSMLSSVEGTLEAINLRRKRFTIWDRVSGRPVSVLLTGETREQVKLMLDKRVLVAGNVYYYRTGIPRLITNAHTIRDITEPPDRPKAGFGSIPELGEGTSGSELLRTLRD